MILRVLGRVAIALALLSACMAGCDNGTTVEKLPFDASDTMPEVVEDTKVTIGPEVVDVGADVVDIGITAPDLPDVQPDLPAPWGDWGKPCADNADCQSGFCLEVAPGESVCTVICVEECPENWYCKGVETPPDWTFVCVPPAGNICQPCDTDADCQYKGDLCIPVGDSGIYCGSACEDDQKCPEHYSCIDLVDLGLEGKQCVPDTGSCVCDHELDGTVQECETANEWGSCSGEQTCDGPAGWSDCNAQVAQAEECNGLDDDCDGDLDEGLVQKPCLAENEFGSCPGMATCLATDGWYCDAKQPTAEVCDGLDNNCNGVVDDGFAGLAEACDGLDNDCDGLVDEGYADFDGDKVADCMDPDDDNDGALDDDDCGLVEPLVAPGLAEECDGLDNDCDGIVDNEFFDTDGDGIADCVDKDSDGDGIQDFLDNCPQVVNPGQANSDNDGLGDACDTDDDNDGVVDGDDNCPVQPNQGQDDLDGDLEGDSCDPDIDGDGHANAFDCGPLQADVFPGAAEQCNGLDDNCNSLVDEGFVDSDNDKVADCMDPDDDGDLDPDITDCAPLDPTVFTGAEEICDAIDNNCDGAADEGCPPVAFVLLQRMELYFAEQGDVRARMVVGDPVSGTVVNENTGYVLKWGAK